MKIIKKKTLEISFCKDSINYLNPKNNLKKQIRFSNK